MKVVLLVDTDEQLLNYLRHFFERVGVDAYIARNTHEALALFDNILPEIVFMDTDMPDITGGSVMQRMRERNQQIKIYFFTGDYAPISLKEAKKLGAEGVFTKPIMLYDLLEVLQKG